MSAVSNQPQLHAIAPYFFVADIRTAAAYYRDVLGFTIDNLWGDPPSFCMPYRDGLTVMLKQADDRTRIRPHGSDGCTWDAYVWVRDADALCQEFAAKGARIVYGPEDKAEYGNREFAIYDVDGYLIAFGHNVAAKKQDAAPE